MVLIVESLKPPHHFATISKMMGNKAWLQFFRCASSEILYWEMLYCVHQYYDNTLLLIASFLFMKCQTIVSIKKNTHCYQCTHTTTTFVSFSALLDMQKYHRTTFRTPSENYDLRP